MFCAALSRNKITHRWTRRLVLRLHTCHYPGRDVPDPKDLQTNQEERGVLNPRRPFVLLCLRAKPLNKKAGLGEVIGIESLSVCGPVCVCVVRGGSFCLH